MTVAAPWDRATQAVDDLVSRLMVDWKKVLKEGEAVIAGGCLLSAIHGYPVADVDVYVTRQRAPEAEQLLQEAGYTEVKIVRTYYSRYLAKNLIQSQRLFELAGIELDAFTTASTGAHSPPCPRLTGLYVSRLTKILR